MEEKSIEQILQLSQNPHYVLNEADYNRLQEYMRTKNKDNVKNTNFVLKNSSEVQKHDTEN